MTLRPYILVVAVEDYPKHSVVASPLRGTTENARKFVETLRSQLNIPDQNILFCSSRNHSLKTHSASRQGVQAAIDVLLQRFANQVGQLFVYLSGHGLTTSVGATDDSWLLCEDFVDETSSTAAVSIDELSTILARGLGAGEHFIFVDACRSQSHLRAKPLQITPLPAATGIAKRFIIHSAGNQGVAFLDEVFVDAVVDSIWGNLSADADPKNPGQNWITFDSLRTDVQAAFDAQRRSLYLKTIGASNGRIRPVPPARPVKTIRDRSKRKAPPVELLQFFDEITFFGETNSQLAGLPRDDKWQIVQGKKNFLEEAFNLREGRKWNRLEIFSIDDLSTAGRLSVNIDQLERERNEAQEYLKENAHRLADTVRLYRYDYPGFYGSFWTSATGKRRAHMSPKQADLDIRFASAVDYIDYNVSRLREIDDFSKTIDKIRSLQTTSLLFEYPNGDSTGNRKKTEKTKGVQQNHQSIKNDSTSPASDVQSKSGSSSTFPERALHALNNKLPSQLIGGKRAIIGPAARVLSEDADLARDALIRGDRPTPQQLNALQYAIRMTRPSLYCHPTNELLLPEDGSWLKQEWLHFQSTLQTVQRSIARIEIVADTDRLMQGRIPIGSGFLVAPGILMTAKHVIRNLRSDYGSFRSGSAMVDFCGYFNVPGVLQFQVSEIVAEDNDHDLGLLRIDGISSELKDAPFLLESNCDPIATSPVCIVGYPLCDSRNPPEFMSLLFEQNFGCKRAAIGEVSQSRDGTFSHDCSTLGGNSGSPVFDVAHAKFCGVHVAGELWSENKAVPASVAKAFVDQCLLKKPFISFVSRSSKQESALMSNKSDRFRKYLSNLKESDPAITNELEGTMRTESTTGLGGMQEEAIVLTQGRPVLDIKNNQVVIDIQEVQSKVWRDRLKNAIPLFRPIIPAVGRIEVANFPGAEWLGTGWLVRDNIVVTNRHVASVFAERQGEKFQFIPDLDGGPTKVNIDFMEEFESDSSHNFPLFEIVHIEKPSGHDIAFLRIEPVSGHDLPAPIPIESITVASREQVAIIGYPARDPFFPDPATMDRIFGARYDKKRLAPGLVQEVTSTRLFHDCTTLGGNSGSVIVSITSGKAVALHFAGTMFSKNHAVPIAIVHETLDRVLRRPRSGVPPLRTPETNDPDPKPGVVLQNSPNRSQTASVIETTIPIKIRIEIGEALNATGISQTFSSPGTSTTAPTPPPAPTRYSPKIVAVDADDDMIETTEAKVSDYKDRKGYQPDFMGEEFEVPLPELTENEEDAFEFEGSSELKYKNFSVVMSKSRRMCRFSAVNIDGSRSKKTRRPGWQFDPRVPKQFQIMKECYGNPPKFSRGHMTRREDPAWGNQAEAQLGNADSMHVTNAVPQMQVMNGGLWLALEDYALQNARKDKMRISVFTGPFLERNDPFRFDVKIPTKFWKVIAFIHDETGDLCATGYTMSQRSFLEDEEFVFGRHENTQVPIHVIEKQAGISFGPLKDVDPKNNESLSAEQPLSLLSQIRFF
jgi:endonuclease G, mitochondrial